MIMEISDVSEFDVSFDYINKIVFVHNDMTARILYSFIMDTFDDPEQMDDPVPMSIPYICECCGHAPFKLLDSWVIEGEHHIRNEVTGK